jgi:cyclase
MLKKRIIPILLYQQGRLVKSKRFTDFRDVGNPVTTAKIYCDQDADELVILNIDSDDVCSNSFLDCIRSISKTCNVPLTVGGGINTFEYAENLFSEGADKVLMGTSLINFTSVGVEITKKYGSQALVACADFVKNKDNTYLIRSGMFDEDLISLEEFLSISTKVGAGELVLQSVYNDGTCEGLDIDFFETVKHKVSLPIILAGGCGDMQDFKLGFEKGATAIGCGSFFCFGDNNPLRVKSQLANYGLPLKRIK